MATKADTPILTAQEPNDSKYTATSDMNSKTDSANDISGETARGKLQNINNADVSEDGKLEEAATVEEDKPEAPPGIQTSERSHDSRVAEIARSFTSEELYQIYLQKLERDRDTITQKIGKAPQLARNFIDFLSSIESRLMEVEQKVNVEEKEPEEILPDGGLNSSKSTPSVQFYEYNREQELDSRARKTRTDLRRVQGSFRCEDDRRSCLRVLYRWKPSAGETVSNPSPGSIGVCAIWMNSGMLARWFRVKMNLGPGDAVEIVEPFRPLIKQFAEFKAHFSMFLKTYGWVIDPVQACLKC